MRNPTQADWNRLKERRKGQHRPLFDELPDDLFLADDDDGPVVPPPSPTIKRRQFRRLDESWAEKLLADLRTPPHVRLLVVLLAEADFHRQIRITGAIGKAARLTRWQKYRALKRIERQGYVSVDWRGRGRPPIATPLHLFRKLVRE